MSRLSTPAWTAIRALRRLSKLCMYFVSEYSRLQCIAHSHASQNPIADLLPQAGRRIQRRVQAQSNRPHGPSQQNALAVATDPVDDQTGERATQGCEQSRLVLQRERSAGLLTLDQCDRQQQRPCLNG